MDILEGHNTIFLALFNMMYYVTSIKDDCT